jgi:hypothetical protein
MPGIAEEYLSRAKEYRRLAERTGDQLIAEYLIDLAEAYEEEARKADRSPPEGSSALQ